MKKHIFSSKTLDLHAFSYSLPVTGYMVRCGLCVFYQRIRSPLRRHGRWTWGCYIMMYWDDVEMRKRTLLKKIFLLYWCLFCVSFINKQYTTSTNCMSEGSSKNSYTSYELVFFHSPRFFIFLNISSDSCFDSPLSNYQSFVSSLSHALISFRSLSDSWLTHQNMFECILICWDSIIWKEMYSMS